MDENYVKELYLGELLVIDVDETQNPYFTGLWFWVDRKNATKTGLYLLIQNNP